MSELRGYLHEKLGGKSVSEEPSVEFQLTDAQRLELKLDKELTRRAFAEFYGDYEGSVQ